MQIHISWKALLAGIILLIGLGLLLRTATLFFTAGNSASAAMSPSPAVIPSVATAAAAAPVATSTVEPPTPTMPPAPPTPEPASPTPEPTAIVPPTPTEPPASPTPFQPPTREPTPMPEALVVVAQGFGQRPGEVSYAFVVSNPNPDLMAQRVRYQVAVYDASGIVLATDTDEIAQIGPGQQMGVAKQLSLAASLVVARIDVLVRPGQYVSAPPLQLLEVTNAAFVDGDPPNLTGILHNPLARDLADFTVIGIAYDDFGIIGGGSVVLPFVPASGQAPVSIPLITDQQATRVEFYAPISTP